MIFDDEKDYIMRIIKEMVRVLFSLMLGKKYVAVEMERDNGYEVSGRKLAELFEMIDRGEIKQKIYCWKSLIILIKGAFQLRHCSTNIYLKRMKTS